MATSVSARREPRPPECAGVEETAVGQQRANAQFEPWKSEYDRMQALADAKTITPKLAEETELQRADEAVQVASARLAQQIRWEYAPVLHPVEETLYPISLVELTTPAQSLVAMGLSNRPEISETRHLICEAVERLNRATI